MTFLETLSTDALPSVAERATWGIIAIRFFFVSGKPGTIHLMNASRSGLIVSE
jgi:hypothetical protein